MAQNIKTDMTFHVHEIDALGVCEEQPTYTTIVSLHSADHQGEQADIAVAVEIDSEEQCVIDFISYVEGLAAAALTAPE